LEINMTNIKLNKSHNNNPNFKLNYSRWNLIFFPKNNERNQLPHNSAFDAIPDLPTDIQELMLQAVEVRNAYAPYSKFRVGVASFR
jgi:hypothetical protein